MAQSQGPIERQLRAQLRAAGWKTSLTTEAGTLGAMAIDLAQTRDATKDPRDKATLNRELRITLQAFRVLAEPVGGDAVDEAANERAGGAPGAADPDRAGGSNVRPFGRRRPKAG